MFGQSSFTVQISFALATFKRLFESQKASYYDQKVKRNKNIWMRYSMILRCDYDLNVSEYNKHYTWWPRADVVERGVLTQHFIIILILVGILLRIEL